MKRILISVTNKDGIEQFERLIKLNGWEIISTGGTATKLKEFGIPYIPIEDITGIPEMMDGRVKTLSHKVFGGILAERSKESHLQAVAKQGMHLIDIVAVNLYDFAAEQNIERIDIGGPSLIRAAAKNYQDCCPIVDPADYDNIIGEIETNGGIYLGTRQAMAQKVFEHTAEYDKAIAMWMAGRNLDKKGFGVLD